jgi:hypothetical protein
MHIISTDKKSMNSQYIVSIILLFLSGLYQPITIVLSSNYISVLMNRSSLFTFYIPFAFDKANLSKMSIAGENMF